MTKSRPSKATRQVLDFCQELGLTDVELRNGKKHQKLYINGRLVRVLSHGTKSDTGDKGLRNVMADIKRVAQGTTA